MLFQLKRRSFRPAPSGRAHARRPGVEGLEARSLLSSATPDLGMTGVRRSPAPIDFGTPVGPDLFDATTDVPGTFTDSPGPGTILGVGVHTLSVTFTLSTPRTTRP